MVALVLIPVGVVGILLARSADEQRQGTVDELTALKLIEIQDWMTWIHHDMLVDVLVADLNGSRPDEARLALFDSQRASAMAELEEIAAGESAWVDEALDLQDLYNVDENADLPYDPFLLDELHYMGMFTTDDSGSSAGHSEHEVAVNRTMLPRLVLVDALAVALRTRDAGPSAWSQEFVDYTYEVLVDAPGWFGPDRGMPLTDSVVATFEESRFDQNLGMETAASLSELRLVWDYDQWLIRGAGNGYSESPPLTMEQLLLAANTSTSALRSDALASVEDDVEEVMADTPSQLSVSFWYVAGVGSLIVGFVMIAVLLFQLLGRQRSLAESALTDPLTGARNRRYLDTEVLDMCSKPGGHHVLVMVDLDRFKLVNDTWGHDVGDALLQMLTLRLSGATERLRRDRPDLTTSIVRTGGDEFVVAFHSDRPIDAGNVERHLRVLEGPLELGQEDAIDLEFSLGIVEAHGRVDLASLLRAADFAAYEDKKVRASARRITIDTPTTPATIEIP